LYALALCTFAQADWLKRFPSLDVIRERTANLCHESSLIFSVPERSRGERGGPQVQIRSGELPAQLPHRFSSSHSLIPNAPLKSAFR
jgi:hypothetical protein